MQVKVSVHAVMTALVSTLSRCIINTSMQQPQCRAVTGHTCKIPASRFREQQSGNNKLQKAIVMISFWVCQGKELYTEASFL